MRPRNILRGKKTPSPTEVPTQACDDCGETADHYEKYRVAHPVTEQQLTFQFCQSCANTIDAAFLQDLTLRRTGYQIG